MPFCLSSFHAAWSDSWRSQPPFQALLNIIEVDSSTASLARSSLPNDTVPTDATCSRFRSVQDLPMAKHNMALTCQGRLAGKSSLTTRYLLVQWKLSLLSHTLGAAFKVLMPLLDWESSGCTKLQASKHNGTGEGQLREYAHTHT